MTIERHFRMTLAVPRGTIAIGGYAPVPEELDVVHAHDADGRPVIPSTALRGALREGLEALVRGAGGSACRGGDGVDPSTDDAPHEAPGGPAAGEGDRAATSVPCTLVDGGPCLPCQLFGSRDMSQSSPTAGLARATPSSGALVLEDATAPDRPTSRAWSTTHGVTINRQSRSAREGLLFNRSAPATGGDLAFVAEGRLTYPSPALREALDAAAAVTRHIGSNLSRGLGRVDIDLEWRAAPATAPQPRDGADHRVVITLRRPASIGVPLSTENFNRTRLDIPGSTLRGAVGWAIAESIAAERGDPDADAPFQALVAEDGAEDGAGEDGPGAPGAIFDFLYPCDPVEPGEADEPGPALPVVVGPWPLTRRECKVHRSHPYTDVLLDRLAVALSPPGEAGSVAQAVSAQARCALCQGPLKPAKGYRGQTRSVSTRTITRVSLDGRRRSARDGALFSHELIERETRFVGSIRGVPAGSAGRLAAGLAAPLSLGRGRSMGWGRVDVEVQPLPALADLGARRDAFQKALSARLAALGVTPGVAVDRLAVVTLLSPMLPGSKPSADDPRADIDALLAGLPGGARCVLPVRRFDVESGWDQRPRGGRRGGGPRPRMRSVVAGSVYVIESAAPWSTLRAALAASEREGIGAGRCRGFGRVVWFDPALTQFEGRPMRDREQTDGARRALVKAADAVMDEAFNGGLDRGRLSKSQMSQLIGVCQEATCHEEVVNYLRYQAGRSDPSWTLSMVERVVGGVTKVFSDHGVSDSDETQPQRVAFWRRYATYLARSFTWQDAKRRQREGHR